LWVPISQLPRLNNIPSKNSSRSSEWQQTMPKILRILPLLFITLVTISMATSADAEPIEISIGVSQNHTPAITKIMKEFPNVCAEDDFFSADWYRISLEFFLVCRAIRIGGIEATYSFKDYPNSARTRAELKKGSTMLMVDLPWGQFSEDESLYKSIEVLKVGDFVKGIYTRPDHTELLKAKTLEELRNFIVVSNKTWIYDWDALERMKVKKLSVSKYDLMGRMVVTGRADFLVAEFPGTDDLSQYIDGVKFIPVPGLKIALLGSRHVAISKKFPKSKLVFEAIQVGLKSLRKRGLISKGYRVTGFSSSLIKDWRIICCQEKLTRNIK
jgi:hypothetical protein